MTEPPRLVVGSRGSPLALWQTEHVITALKAAHPGLEAEIVIIKTHGDKILDVPLARIGDRGLFVREIEEALLAGTIDLAVHSLKDLPTEQPAGLSIVAVGERADARDCVVSPRFGSLAGLPAKAVIGTSSLRRRAQLLAAFGPSHPGWTFRDVRGNLQTRLGKLDAGDYDALILATAGLERLGLGDRVAERLDVELCMPAVGQGALAIEARTDDGRTRALVAPFEHAETRACVTAERTLLAQLEGGCQVPIGAHATVADGQLTLHAIVASLEGDRLIQAQAAGPLAEAVEIGRKAAQLLLDQGTDEILAAIRAVSLP